VSLKKVDTLPALLKTLETNGVTLLIGATWCMPCKRFMPHFERAEKQLALHGEPHDFRYIYLDEVAGADEATLAELLGVMSVPQVLHLLPGETKEIKSRTVLPLLKELEEINGEGHS
jgi:thiol-disulfide isomerase/thioredoxin